MGSILHLLIWKCTSLHTVRCSVRAPLSQGWGQS